MAFTSKLGNLLKQKICQNLNSISCASTIKPSLLQSIRSMSSSKIFIGGLSYNTDETSLGEACSAYGEVTESKVIMDRETGTSRGFGFVSFTSDEDASKAIQALDGQDLHGRRVRVNYATDRVGGPRNDWGAPNPAVYAGGNTGDYGYGGNGGNSYDNRGNDRAYDGNTAGGFTDTNVNSGGDVNQGGSGFATGSGGGAYGGNFDGGVGGGNASY